MKTSIASLLLAGGLLALGACATTDATDMAQAGLSGQCRSTPAGSTPQDGADVRCASTPVRAPREVINSSRGSLSSSVDRSMRRGG